MYSVISCIDIQDLDLRNPGVRKPNKRMEFETTTQEVLREADFRVCMIMKLNVISCDNFAYMRTSSEKGSLFFSFNVCWGRGFSRVGKEVEE